MYNNEIWTKHTRLILTGVIIVAIAGWVAGILQTASIAIDTANDLLKTASEEELPLKPFTLSATNPDYHRLHLVPRRTEWL
mgnify:CR=1 FL=1